MNASFAEPAETVVLTLGPILEGDPVTCVEHDEQGRWHFLDGECLVETEDLSLVALGILLGVHPTLGELSDLLPGWRAFRTAEDEPWERESRALKERSRARTADALAELARNRVSLPAGFPTTTEMIRAGREGLILDDNQRMRWWRMGAWGAGNFEDDKALDWLWLNVQKPIVKDIESMLESHDEERGPAIIAAIEVLAVLCERCPAVPPQPHEVTAWHESYLQTWNDYTEDLCLKPEFKNEKRKVIDATFESLLAQSRAWHLDKSGSAVGEPPSD